MHRIRNHCIHFFKLLNEPLIQILLQRDSCGIVADKYNLAIVFIYFLRAKLQTNEYNCWNFHVALYLSHDIYEDFNFKNHIVNNLLGIDLKSKDLDMFLEDRLNLAIRIDFRVFVTGEKCEEVFHKFPCHFWGRERSTEHLNIKQYCQNCNLNN